MLNLCSDVPIKWNIDESFSVQGDGDKHIYYYFNLSDPHNKPPKYVQATLDSNINDEAMLCGDETDFVAQRECERILMGSAVSNFWG